MNGLKRQDLSFARSLLGAPWASRYTLKVIELIWNGLGNLQVAWRPKRRGENPAVL
jgi:hypothetical protein